MNISTNTVVSNAYQYAISKFNVKRTALEYINQYKKIHRI